jgi:hypothetical protein
LNQRPLFLDLFLLFGQSGSGWVYPEQVVGGPGCYRACTIFQTHFDCFPDIILYEDLQFAKWNESKDFLFQLEGWSNSEYTKDTSSRSSSVNGWSVLLNGSAIAFRSKMMPIVALSATEAELFAPALCAQDMLSAMQILNLIGLKVKFLPMKLYADNKGAKDPCHNWSVAGRTRHVEN